MDYQEAKRLLHPDTTRDAIWEIADKQEAIKKINEACVIACEAMGELQQYKQIGTLDEVREAVEKQKAISREIIEGKYFCPKCHNLMPYPGYCGCGQKLY